MIYQLFLTADHDLMSRNSVICADVALTLYGHIKTTEQQTLYSSTMIGTLAVDGWAFTFGTARRGLGGATARPVPSSLYQM